MVNRCALHSQSPRGLTSIESSTVNQIEFLGICPRLFNVVYLEVNIRRDPSGEKGIQLLVRHP